MKTLIIPLGLLILILYYSGLRISLTTFKITWSDWRSFVAVILFLISLYLIQYQSKKEAYSQGYQKGCEEMRIEVLEYLNEELKNKKQ